MYWKILAVACFALMSACQSNTTQVVPLDDLTNVFTEYGVVDLKAGNTLNHFSEIADWEFFVDTDIRTQRVKYVRASTLSTDGYSTWLRMGWEGVISLTFQNKCFYAAPFYYSFDTEPLKELKIVSKSWTGCDDAKSVMASFFYLSQSPQFERSSRCMSANAVRYYV
jgi:hypothetical protein